MLKRRVPVRVIAFAMVSMPVVAVAQSWVPGSELVGQSVIVQTNGTANVVHFDQGGAARIVSPNGRVANASWTAAEGKLCLNSAGSSECWPYRQAFQAGRQVTLTSDCRAVSTWLPNGVNAPPVSKTTQDGG